MLEDLKKLLGPLGDVAENAGVRLGEVLNDLIDNMVPPEDDNKAE